MLKIEPTQQTPASTKKVILKQFGPKQETTFEVNRLNPCCFAASLSYIYPAKRPEKRNAARGFPNAKKLEIRPKCSKPKSSDTVGIMMEN